MVTRSLVPARDIERQIFLIRGHKVMLDADLARIYGVSTKRLNQQVHRNKKRFPDDFMFQLSRKEAESLRLQSATLEKAGRGKHRKYLPLAFTEYGAVMLASVLHTPVAVEASVQIARAFVRLREMVAAHRELARKLEQLERKIENHDSDIHNLFEAIRKLMEPPEKPRLTMGFRP
ncbi:MAG: ORF6N domain-containing protein [Elusimicrobia bacterium]|nr:ORF6N domain-containing protein [Elusimicrobiota bacterium]